jgi:integrase
MIRGKQRNGKEVVEVVAMSPALANLGSRLRARAVDARMGPVFPTQRKNQPYTESGFKSMWNKLMHKALAAGIITQRFTFHDLRAYYATQHKIQRGALPDLHAKPGDDGARI